MRGVLLALALALAACSSSAAPSSTKPDGSAGSAGTTQDAAAGAGGAVVDGSAGSSAAAGTGGSGGLAGAAGAAGSPATGGTAGAAGGTGGLAGASGSAGAAGTAGADAGATCPSACVHASFAWSTSSVPATGGNGTSKALTDCPAGSTLETGQFTMSCVDYCAGGSKPFKLLSGQWECAGDPNAPDGKVCTITYRCVTDAYCPDWKKPCP